MKKSRHSIFILGILATFIVACSDNSEEAEQTPASDTDEQEQTNGEEEDTGEGEAENGGTLDVAYDANPQTLDPHLTTNQATRDVARHIFEQLLVLDENYEVVPSLAESFDISEDGLVYTFALREDVTFHNGEDLTAEDVVASMEKWLRQSTQGQANFPGAEFTEVDEYTVELHLEEPTLIGPNILADAAPFPGIMPKELAEEAGADGVDEYIGTGPFQLEEWSTDHYTHLTKFEDYHSRDEEPSGLAGQKEALVDEVYFHYVTDASTRVQGVTTGEYDIAFGIPFDNADQLDQTDGVSGVFDDGGIISYVFNNSAGPFSDVALREALTTAVDNEAALTSAFSDDRFYELDSALMIPSQVDWHSSAGEEVYNQNDLEKARELVEESDYDNEEITLLTTRDYPEQYNISVVTQQVLEEIGVNAELDVYDWPTVQEIREDDSNFDLFVMTFAVRPTLHQLPFLDSAAAYPGWTDSEEIDRLLDEITAASTVEEAQPLVDELQAEVWEYLPVAKIGNIQDLVAVGDHVSGYENLIGPILWNVSVED